MTTVFAGLTAFDGPEMFESMDAAFDHGAQGIALFTVGSLRSPETRAQFREYTDRKRAERAAGRLVATGPTQVDTNPFNKDVIMGFVNTKIAAYTSLARAASLPELRRVDWATIDAITVTPLQQANTSEDYLSRLRTAIDPPRGRNDATPPRSRTEWQPIVNALINSYSEDISLSEFTLNNQFGTTYYYLVTELNTGIVFHVDFYLYGDLVSGWSVAPETESFNAFIRKNGGNVPPLSR
jgi:hypothetical protein